MYGDAVPVVAAGALRAAGFHLGTDRRFLQPRLGGGATGVTALGAALGFILVDARITQLDVPGLDNLLAIHAFSFAFTVFAVTGVAHSINIIDGLNGLSGVVAILAAIGLAILAATVGDTFVLSAACVLAASIAGFLVLNYPRGRIFLGDGGAYLVGLLLAELSVILVHRNSEVSPWFPLVLLAYPVWETLFSMYRRKKSGGSTGEADCLHFHTLVYRRVVRWHSFRGAPRDYVTRNSIASTCLWLLPVMCLVIALSFWQSSRRSSSLRLRLAFLTRSLTAAWCASAFRRGS